MTFEWISWLGDTLKIIGDLIPRRILIDPSERGIKFKGMKKVIILEPGCHWWVPFFTKVRTEPFAQQTLSLGEQTLVSKDGTAITIDSSILFNIEDFETAATKFHSYLNQIDDDARNVVSLYISGLNFRTDIVGNLNTVTKHLTFRIRKKLAKYGIRVSRFQLTSIATGIPIMLIGHKQDIHVENRIQ